MDALRAGLLRIPSHRVRREPGSARFRWAPSVAAGLLLSLVALKLTGTHEPPIDAGHRRSLMSLCDDPWLVPNALMFIGELGGGLTIGALLGVAAMTAAAVFSLWAGAARIALAGCGCFGSFDAPWHVHLAVAVFVGAICAAAVPSIVCRSASRRCRSRTGPFVRRQRTRSKP
jgi:hypothetical protein